MSYLALAFLLVAGAPAGARQAVDEIMVRFAPGVADAGARDALSAIGAREVDRLDSVRVRLVRLPPGLSVPDAVARISRNPNVLAAEPNIVMRAKALPNDTHFPLQWALDRISASQCWASGVAGSTGSASIIIAVVDSGIELAHPDLASKLVAGANMINEGASANDDNGHGTGVAAVAAAATGNGAGIAGVAWNARLMPVKVLDSTGAGSEFNILKGVLWAVEHGARVINLSLGSCDPDTKVCDQGGSIGAAVMQQAWAAGAVIVAATGNEATDNTSFPAGYPYVLGVGATDRNDQLAFYSNRGSALDVVAPGGGGASACDASVDIMSAILTGQVCDNFAYPAGYGTEAGTSFAAPIVSGLAAVILGANPAMTPDQVVSLLEATADRAPGAGWSPNYGYGRVNMLRALSGSVAAPPAAGAIAWVHPNPFSPVLERYATFSIPGGRGKAVRIEIRDSSGLLVWTRNLPAGETAGMDLYHNSPVRWDGGDAQGRGLANGVYTARITVGSGTCVKRIVVAR